MAGKGINLGNAYLSVSPSFSGFGRSVTKELGGAVSPVSQKIHAGLGAAFLTAGKVGVGAIASVGTAVAGLTLKGGINRALQIEQAQAKLTGLGMSAKQVSGIMNDALKSVKGTAFGLGDAATVAASLAASGVKSGKQMQDVLRTVADTAAMSGRSMTDIGTIFGSVAARGKLQGDDMLQLMSSGVPVLQLLAKQTGKTSAQMSDLVSKGKVDFNTFAKAMQSGMGGASLAAGKTFNGAMSNAKAALSRLGESAATPALHAATQAFNVLTPQVDKFSKVAKPGIDAFYKSASTAFGYMKTSASQDINAFTAAFDAADNDITSSGIPGVFEFLGGTAATIKKDFSGLWGDVAGGPLGDKAVQLWNAVGNALTSLLGMLSKFGSVLGPLVVEFAKLAGGAVLGALMVAFTALRPILNGLATAFQAVGNFVKDHETAFRVLAVTVTVFGAALLGPILALRVFVGVVSKVTAVIGVLKKAFAAIKLAFNAFRFLFLTNPFGLIIAGVLALVVAFIYAYKHSETFRRIVNSALSAVKKAALAVGSWFAGPFVGFFKSAWSAITGAFSAIGSFFVGIWDSVKNAFKVGIDAVVGFVKSYWPVIIGVLTGPLGFLVAETIKHWDAVKTAFSTAINAVKGFLTGLWTSLSNTWAFKAMESLFVTGLQIIKLSFQLFVTGVTILWTRFWNGLKIVAGLFMAGLRAVISAGMWVVHNVIMPPLNAIRSAWATAWNAIKKVASTVWNGIRAVVSAVWNAIVGFVIVRLTVMRNNWAAIWNGVKAVTSAVWNGISTVIRTVWNAVVGFIAARLTVMQNNWSRGFNAIKNAASSAMGAARRGIQKDLDGIKGAFSTSVGAIKKVWNGLKSIMKAPIKWVIDNVINKFISAIRKVQGFLKVPGNKQFPPVKIPGFRKGGYTGDGSADAPAGVVHAGEYVLTKRETRRMGGAVGVETWKRHAPGYKTGGYVGGRGRFTPKFAAVIQKAADSLGTTLQLAQRGWNPANGLSGTSHAGDALDVSGGGDLWKIRDALRKVGVAAWVRGPAQGFSWHVHGVPQSPAFGTGRGSALYQAMDYRKGGAGLHGVGQADPYSRGSKIILADGSSVGGGNLLSDLAQKAWDKITSPIKGLADKYLKDKPLGETWSKIPGMVIDNSKKWLSEQLGKLGSVDGDSNDSSNGGSGGMEKWRPLIMQAMARTGFGSAVADVNRWLRQVMSESSGNSAAKQGVRDVNSGGNEAYGLLQVIPETFRQYRDPSLPNDRGNPLANAVAAMRYTKARYGSRWRSVIGHGHGYAMGGDVFRDVIAPVAERGPEIVTSRQNRFLSKGSHVYTASETRNMLGGNQSAVFNLYDQDGVLLGAMYGKAVDAIEDRGAMMARIGAR
jgi:tape measure domain-containing protein